MTAFYNEIDKYAAAWLRNLIAAGHIAPGVVDERSIEDILPEELLEYTQCHFFAGIGVWSHALRLAGWPDDRAVWTGSCPCQPFSAAGKGAGTSDLRHLWPAFHHLVHHCHPPVVFGEQVASKDGLNWLDLVQADLEVSGYAVGATDMCAAGVGAPHIRQRLYFVAESAQQQHGPRGGRAPRRDEHSDCGIVGIPGFPNLMQPEQPAGERPGSREADSRGPRRESSGPGEAGDMADAQEAGRRLRGSDLAGGDERGEAQELEQRSGGSGLRTLGHPQSGRCNNGILRIENGAERTAEGRRQTEGLRFPDLADSGHAGLLAHHHHQGLEGGERAGERTGIQRQAVERGGEAGGAADPEHAKRRPVDEHREDGCHREDAGRQEAHGIAGACGEVRWSACDWIYCRDGKWRPVEPGTFPLAHGAPNRVGRLRAYGNAIVAPCAQTFISSYLEAVDLRFILS